MEEITDDNVRCRSAVGQDIYDLNTGINHYGLEGWEPFGDVFRYGKDFAQILVRTLHSKTFVPRVFIDGNHWCALYGANIQDGIAGFGKSPAEAVFEYDKQWFQKISTQRTE